MLAESELVVENVTQPLREKDKGSNDQKPFTAKERKTEEGAMVSGRSQLIVQEPAKRSSRFLFSQPITAYA
jgi:hypothetical protein